MNPVRIPRHRPPQWPAWARRLARSVRRGHLRLRIAQLEDIVETAGQQRCVAADDLALYSARLAELRCELCVLEMQQ